MKKTIDGVKNMPIWLLWRKQNRGGKISKVPFAASGKPSGTSETYRDTWVTHAEALQAASTKKADGVGFVIPKGMFFLDIDHRDLNDPMVQEIIARFNSYSEISASGEGIHIYGLCDVDQLPVSDGKLSIEYYTHHPDNGLELYIGGLTNRFTVFTGNTILDKPLVDCTAAILDILNRYMRKPQPKSALEKKADKLIQELRNQKNGDKFSALFDHGQILGQSHSEADACLCAMIAFRAGDKPDLIEAVFRQSALYRAKWEREDYRQATITRGIEASKRLKSRKKPRPAFIKVDEKTQREFVSATLLAKYIREHMDYLLVRDDGNQAILKYVYQGGVYKLYDLNMLHGAIKQFIADYNEELIKMSTVKEVAQLLLSDLNYVSQTDLNCHEDLINFQNGLLQVTGNTTTLFPHSPKVLSTIQIPCNWSDTEIPAPVFDQYLDTLTDGDATVRQLLLEVMGVAISNVQGWRTKKALFLVGEGNTGKSQLKSLTERLLGKGNYIGMDLSEMEARFGTGSLYGKRLAGSSDMSFLSVAELKVFKKLTGGDNLHMEYKGQQAFSATFTGILWFCTNKLPKWKRSNNENRSATNSRKNLSVHWKQMDWSGKKDGVPVDIP